MDAWWRQTGTGNQADAKQAVPLKYLVFFQVNIMIIEKFQDRFDLSLDSGTIGGLR